jgi:hypothetical protein
MSTMADREKSASEAAVLKLPELLDQLAEMGVEHMEFIYDGSGDDGEFVDCTWRPWRDVDIGTDFLRKVEATLEVAYLHGSWCTEDGAYGHFEVDVAERTIGHVHNERYMSYTTECREHEFPVELKKTGENQRRPKLAGDSPRPTPPPECKEPDDASS